MKIKVAYANVPNAGDLLNVCLLEKVFGVTVEHTSKYLSADLVAIGSALGLFQKSNKIKTRIKQQFQEKGNPYVWGTGFMYSERINEKPFCEKMKFTAVRGKLSLERVEKIGGGGGNHIPLCDGGILTSFLFDKIVEKKYEVGVIPHFKEQDEIAFQRMLSISKKSTMIDLRCNPLDVFHKIAECEFVLSSSLHGLIVADSFGIPNLHVKVSNKMMGDGFKFRDYYSGYELEDDFFNANIKIPSINDIIDAYKILPEVVSKKKEQMIKCFPFQ